MNKRHVNKRHAFCAACTLVLCAFGAHATIDSSRRDPLTTSAALSAAAAHSALVSVTQAGSGLVAVGRHGAILASSDAGQHWQQMPCPVSSDLTAVKFLDASHGWIVGHDAVVLKTSDGGKSWQRMLDGRGVLKLLKDTYGAQGRAPNPAVAEDVERASVQSATPGVLPYPLLDVWFSSPSNGFVVGAFGLILHTADGGASWTPWIERTANIRMNHIYAIGGSGGVTWLAGEQGLLRKLEAGATSFSTVDSPYQGSFFGLRVEAGRLVAHGLRGNAYISQDGGSRWQKAELPTAANIVAALPAQGDDLLFVAQNGEVFGSRGDGSAVRAMTVERRGEVYGAAVNGGALVVTGLSGARVLRKVAITTP